MDVRLLAAIAATLMLVIGVMWVVPTTPNSNNFRFDIPRRGLSDARPIEFAKPVQGNIVDGSDADFYRIGPLQGSLRLDVRLDASAKLIPGLFIVDGAKNIVQEKTAEYVRSPGASISSSFPGQPGMTYYFQVFGQRNTTGSYALTVTADQ